jgi:hypothetical protein
MLRRCAQRSAAAIASVPLPRPAVRRRATAASTPGTRPYDVRCRPEALAPPEEKVLPTRSAFGTYSGPQRHRRECARWIGTTLIAMGCPQNRNVREYARSTQSWQWSPPGTAKPVEWHLAPIEKPSEEVRLGRERAEATL